MLTSSDCCSMVRLHILSPLVILYFQMLLVHLGEKIPSHTFTIPSSQQGEEIIPSHSFKEV